MEPPAPNTAQDSPSQPVRLARGCTLMVVLLSVALGVATAQGLAKLGRRAEGPPPSPLVGMRLAPQTPTKTRSAPRAPDVTTLPDPLWKRSPRQLTPEAEEAIGRAVEQFMAAAAAGDGPRFAASLDLRRLVQELGDRRWEKALRVAVARPLDMIEWRDAGPARRVRTLPNDDALAVVGATLGERRVTLRVWLHRAVVDDTWRVWDWETVQRSFRFSAALRRPGEDPRSLEQFEATSRAVEELQAQGDHERAIAELIKARTSAPDRFRGGLLLLEASSALHLGRHSDGLALAEAALALSEPPAYARVVRAGALVWLERYQEAEQEALGYIEELGDDAEALAIVGRCRLESGRGGAAEEALRRGIAVDPLDIDCRLMLGDHLLDARRDEALPLIARAAIVGADPIDCLMNPIEELFALGDPASVVSLCELVLRERDDPEVRAALTAALEVRDAPAPVESAAPARD